MSLSKSILYSGKMLQVKLELKLVELGRFNEHSVLI